MIHTGFGRSGGNIELIGIDEVLGALGRAPAMADLADGGDAALMVHVEPSTLAAGQLSTVWIGDGEGLEGFAELIGAFSYPIL